MTTKDEELESLEEALQEFRNDIMADMRDKTSSYYGFGSGKEKLVKAIDELVEVRVRCAIAAYGIDKEDA